MKAIIYLLMLQNLFCASSHKQTDTLQWTRPDVKGHWKLFDTEIVEKVPFLNLMVSEPDQMNMVSEESPWDFYTEFDLVFEEDSMYMVNYPIQAFTAVQYFLDSGYLHLGPKDNIIAYPAELINDTLIFYRPLKSQSVYFKERYLRTNFNDSILNVMKNYGINYPALAGTWILVREKDFDYGTHYELKFPHSIPDSVEFSKEQMISALVDEKIYRMITDGVKRDYFFFYRNPYIYFKPGKWYKGEDPLIHFIRK